MATPMKRAFVAFVENLKICVACSKPSRQRYYIKTKAGSLGPSYDIATEFYNVDSFESGAFLCIGCKRLLTRILDMRQSAEKLENAVRQTTQTIKIETSSKRMIERTPNERSKRFHYSTKSPGQRLKALSAVPKSKVGLKFDDSTMDNATEGGLDNHEDCSFSPLKTNEVDLKPVMCNKEVQCTVTFDYSGVKKVVQKPVASNQELQVYRSVKYKNKVSSAVKCLSSGSVRKATRLVLSHEDTNIRVEAQKGVTDIIKHSVNKMLQSQKDYFRKEKEEGLLNFDMSVISGIFRDRSPLLWKVLSTVGTNRCNTSDEVKLTAALCILLNSRSKFLNTFQHVVSISMYNNHLQKEGFNLLSKLGITVGHTTLHKTLNNAQLSVDNSILEMKKSLENNKTLEGPTCHTDHSYQIHERREENPNTDNIPLLDHDYLPVRQNTQNQNFAPAYRFNLDNLDFFLHVRNMTEQHQNQSKHYVQLMAVKDRINCEHLPDDSPLADLTTIHNHQFLPSADDNHSLRNDLIQVISLILTQHIHAFGVFKDVFPSNFEHEYTDCMDQKSMVPEFKVNTVVMIQCILIIIYRYILFKSEKSENKMNDMIDILKYLHKYVPNAKTDEEIERVNEREEGSSMRKILLGGDQLTCERVRGAHMVMMDGDTGEERLEGCLSMIEDFHEKMNFLQMIMDRFYKPVSAREAGTLYQLKNVINRRNVTSTVSKDYHAVSAFVDLAGESHVVSAALTFYGMSDIDATCIRIPNAVHLADNTYKKRILKQIVGEMVDELLLNNIARSIAHIEERGERPAEDEQDGIFNYATNFLKIFLLRKICVLATRSGDGSRIVRHWKYALLLYDQAHKVKYKLEAFLFLAGIFALHTPRHKHQVIWNRFINLTGGRGKNLDGDYVMELLNKYAKSRVKLIGPNHSPELVKRIGKTMMFCHNINHQLECQVNAAPISRQHTAQDTKNDLTKMIAELLRANVFKHIPGRAHATFLSEPADIFENFDVSGFHKWLILKKREYAYSKLAF